MKKFKVGDKVKLVPGLFPAKQNPHLVGSTLTITNNLEIGWYRLKDCTCDVSWAEMTHACLVLNRRHLKGL